MKGTSEDRYRPVFGFVEALRLLAACLVALPAGACSLTYSIVSLEPDEPETTASIAPKAAVSPLSPALDEEDWRRAKAALSVALDPQGAGTLVTWDNPDSSRKGAFTPSGAPFVRNDEICRSFSAEVHAGPPATSLQGTACRPSGGEWAITDLRPAGRAGSDIKPPRTSRRA
ncbi:MAG: RT0821/Lpp0805 family surface protein [Microvirga sp.]